jgi:nitric oxide reductase NorQ protein
LPPSSATSQRIGFHPIESKFIAITDNVQFIAAVNRGSEFSGTFGIDAAQLDRFAPLKMSYLPPEEEVKLLRRRHPELGQELVERVVAIAHAIRRAPELGVGLSVRATEEVCVYLKHPLMLGEQKRMLPEIMKSSYCGRFNGQWDDATSDASAVWALVQRELLDAGKGDPA